LLGLAPGRIATEDDGHGAATLTSHPAPGPSERLATAEIVLAFASRGVRSSVLRLPPTVHGDGDSGFMAMIVGLARVAGTSGYTGDGTNRWPAVHRTDAARLFRLAVELAPAGSTLHAVGDEGVPGLAFAEVIGRHLDLPVVAVAPEDAGDQFFWLADFLSMDSPASSSATRLLLGWEPTGPGLIEDLELGHYFDDPAP
jgi:nucleoside-diphosphate-sugar epimerase